MYVVVTDRYCPTDSGDGGYRDLFLSYVQHRRQQQVPVTLVPSGQSAADLPGTSAAPGSDWQTVADLREQLEAALPPAGPTACLLAIQEASCLVYWLGPAAICSLMRRGSDRGELHHRAPISRHRSFYCCGGVVHAVIAQTLQASFSYTDISECLCLLVVTSRLPDTEFLVSACV